MPGKKYKLSGARVLTFLKRAAIIATLFALYLFTARLLTGYTCFFEALFGVPCPGCGLTRAYIFLLRGDIAGAFAYHPLFWTVPFVAAVFIYRYAKLGGNNAPWMTVFFTVLAALFVIVYIIRMIFLFPHTPPLVINKNALFRHELDLLIKLFRYIFG